MPHAKNSTQHKLGWVGLTKVKGQSKKVILSTAFSHQSSRHKGAGLLPRQLGKSLLLLSLWRDRKVYRRLNWPSDPSSQAKATGDGIGVAC